MISSLTSFLSKIRVALRGSARAALFPFTQRDVPRKSVIACVFSIGERTEEQCIESIRNQTAPVSRIELIKQVTPISTASNRALDLAQNADLLLWVDADMILYPQCNEYLNRLMRPDTLYAVAPLLDPVFGKVGYIKLLNMNMVRRLDIGFRNILGCDVDFCRQAQERDRSITPEAYTLSRRPLGIHHPTYTARELFRKNQIEKKKRGNKVDAKLVDMLARKYRQSPNPVLLAGLLGEIMPNQEMSAGESMPQSGLHQWEMVREMLGDAAEDAAFGFPDGRLPGMND